jgi:hypothetical protein
MQAANTLAGASGMAMNSAVARISFFMPQRSQHRANNS